MKSAQGSPPFKAVWIYAVSMALVNAGLPATRAWATTSSSGEGGSIIVESVDPETGQPIPDSLLKPGMKVKLNVHAYNSAGQPIGCTPHFNALQGVGGDQIGDVGEDSGIVTMGNGFGSAEVGVRCEELPDVRAKQFIVNNTLKAPHPSVFDQPPAGSLMAPVQKAPLAVNPTPDTAPATAPAAGGSGAGTALAILGIGAVVAAVAIVATHKSSPCTPPELFCMDSGKCCPAGSPYYCSTPTSKQGCYTDVFITGCTLKQFCTSEY